MKVQDWVFSVRYTAENTRDLCRRAVVGPARASTVEAALQLMGLSEAVCAEIRSNATVRKFVENQLDPEASGYYATCPVLSVWSWTVCIGSIQEVIR